MAICTAAFRCRFTDLNSWVKATVYIVDRFVLGNREDSGRLKATDELRQAKWNNMNVDAREDSFLDWKTTAF
jgi:hypothetical protein